MRTIEEIKADISATAYGTQHQYDAAWLEWFRVVAQGIEPDRLEEICKAEREGRCVVLNEDVVIAAVRKAILINTDEKRYRYELGKACLTSCCKDAYKYLLQLTREAAEAALKEGGQK